jgi:hypothetical protein
VLYIKGGYPARAETSSAISGAFASLIAIVEIGLEHIDLVRRPDPHLAAIPLLPVVHTQTPRGVVMRD